MERTAVAAPATLRSRKSTQLAISRNGKCLSEHYTSWKAGLLWQCACGNTWRARLIASCSLGSGCPRCSKSRGERLCESISLKQLLGFPFPSVLARAASSMNRGNGMELDGYCPELEFGLRASRPLSSRRSTRYTRDRGSTSEERGNDRRIRLLCAERGTALHRRFPEIPEDSAARRCSSIPENGVGRSAG